MKNLQTERIIRCIRQKLLTQLFLQHDEKLILCGHQLQPFLNGSHACSFFSGWKVEMFFSSFCYIIFILSYSHTNLGCKDRGFFLINKELQEKLTEILDRQVVCRMATSGVSLIFVHDSNRSTVSNAAFVNHKS